MPSGISRGHPSQGKPGEPESLIAEILERHRAFWLRTSTDRPLVRIAPWQDWRPFPSLVLRDGTVLKEAAEIRPGMLRRLANLEVIRPRTLVEGDFINGWGPYDCCWTEAILGCRVRRVGPSMWADQLVQTWDEVDNLSWDERNAWLGELLEVNRVLVQETKGAFPVCQPLMRGPLDMAEAAVPTEALYSGFYDHADRLRRLLELCTDIFVTVAKRRLAETPPFHGGYGVRFEYGLWAPGPVVQFQADAMLNLSPQTYREFMFEFDRRIASQFEYSLIHTHSGSAHILPVLSDEPALTAIEVTLDPAPYGPPPLELLPNFLVIQQAGKALLISGPMKRSEFDTLLERLSPVGLAIRAGLIPE